MKRPTLRTLSILILLAILVSACKMPASQGITPTPNVAATATAQPTQAVPTNTQPDVQPTMAVTELPTTPPTPIPPTATSTPLPTATLPPTPTSSTCTDLAKFVDDVTVPDDTEMLPGQEFIKTWRLQNVGTCTWTSQYAIVFVNGDQMNGTSPLPLTGSIPPNGTLDVSVTLQAPGTTGTYRGDWKLKNPSGVIFGLGNNATETFYVQIVVVEGVSELNLGPASWTDNMDTAYYWYLLDTANTKFTEGEGKLEMKSITPSAGEEWGLANQPSMDDYYLQATFITGDSCSGLDRYGLLTRAPEPNKGYVYEFTCDGHYRLYTWDGKNYNALQEWHTSGSILAGANQTNIMGIYMKGSDIRLYANGHKIAEFTDSTFDHGQFGLVIGSANTPNFIVSVDQVAYWNLNP
ncbi:MAG: NBR1-Ig-like domain-containing protein [Anaerolineales bacterium]